MSTPGATGGDAPASPAPDEIDPAPTTGSARFWGTALVACLLLSLAVYGNALDGEFVFDDGVLVAANPIVKDPGRWLELFGAGTGRLGYRPVRTLSYCLDSLVWGMRPWAFHLSNVLHHALTSLLVLGIALELLGPGLAMWLATLVFVLHPVHTDAITYISGRRDVLSTLLGLAALWVFLRMRRREREGRPAGTTAPVAIALLWGASLLTKEMTVTLPAVMVLVDLVRDGWRATLRRAAFHATLLSAALLFGLYSASGRSGATLVSTHPGGTPGAALMTMARVFLHYFCLWVWPATLVADYSRDAFPVSAGLCDPRGWAALSLHLAVVCGALVRARSGCVHGMAVLATYGTLLPVSQVIPHSEMMAEHYLYLPSAFLALPTGALLARLQAAGGRGRGALVLLVLALLACRTVVRNSDWSTPLDLYEATVRAVPRCARAQANLALALLATGRVAEALEACSRALAIVPDDPYTQNNLGSILVEIGRTREGVDRLRHALRVHPDYPEAWNNLGAALRQVGDLEGSERALRRAVALDPAYAHAFNNLGLTQKRRDRPEKAEESYRRAIAIDRKKIEPRNNLAVLLIETGRPRDALGEIEAALGIAPADLVLQLNRARALRAAGDARQAMALLRRLAGVIAQGPLAPVLLSELARTHLVLGDRTAAREAFARARALGARDPDLEARLGR